MHFSSAVSMTKHLLFLQLCQQDDPSAVCRPQSLPVCTGCLANAMAVFIARKKLSHLQQTPTHGVVSLPEPGVLSNVMTSCGTELGVLPS